MASSVGSCALVGLNPSKAAVELVGHLAVDALGAEMGGATVLAAHGVVVGQPQAVPGPAPQQTHGEGEAEARQEEEEGARRAHPVGAGAGEAWAAEGPHATVAAIGAASADAVVETAMVSVAAATLVDVYLGHMLQRGRRAWRAPTRHRAPSSPGRGLGPNGSQSHGSNVVFLHFVHPLPIYYKGASRCNVQPLH